MMQHVSHRRRLTSLYIIVGIVSFLLEAFLAFFVTALFAVNFPLPLWNILVISFFIAFLLSCFGLLREKLKPAPETPTLEQDYRQQILRDVKTKWITNFLHNNSYYDKELLPLGLRRRVGDPWEPVLQDPLEPAESLPLDKKISDVFDEANGKLLILGEPGAGKTTLLLELVRDLLSRAESNSRYPIPVVLMLSSWATKQLTLEKWIEEELQSEKYQIPRRIAEGWVEHSELLLLLEGLDGVAPDALPACIDAVNNYLVQADRSIVVCSRTKEYREQSQRLSLQTAVTVQALTFQQVEEYLLVLGNGVSGLKNVLEQEQGKSLRALATTPLFLKLLILTYHGKSAEELLPLIEAASVEEKQHELFHTYIERVLQKDGSLLHATAQKTKHWLAWLAYQLTSHNHLDLYLEYIQPDWLPKRQKYLYWGSFVLLIGLVTGVVTGLTFGSVAGLIVGLLVGPVAGLIYGREIQTIKVSWSWGGFLISLLFGLGLGGLLALGIATGGIELLTKSGVKLDVRLLYRGLIIGLAIWLSFGPTIGLYYGLILGLLFVGELPPESLSHSPNEGIRRSVTFGLVGGLLGGLASGWFFFALPFFGHLFGLGDGKLGDWLIVGLHVWLLAGLFFGLFFGLYATVQYSVIRLWLWQAGCTPVPWHYVAFLDDTVEQQLLRKVDGSYIFRHDLLQRYFASLEVKLPVNGKKDQLTQTASSAEEPRKRENFSQPH